MYSIQQAPLIFKIFGVAMMLFSWAPVAFPHIRVSLRGGNRAPLSMHSKLVLAIGVTCWCLAIFGVYPRVCGGMFALSVCIGLFQSKRDRAAYDVARGLVTPRFTITTEQRWLALCFADAFFLTLSLYAVIRDYRFPPHTDEQRIVHFMSLGYAVASTIGAIVLYFTRPKKQP